MPFLSSAPFHNFGHVFFTMEIASGTGILPVIPNRQAGSLSHHSLLAMTFLIPVIASPAKRGTWQSSFRRQVLDVTLFTPWRTKFSRFRETL